MQTPSRKTDHICFSNSWKFSGSWQSRDKDPIVHTPTKESISAEKEGTEVRWPFPTGYSSSLGHGWQRGCSVDSL